MSTHKVEALRARVRECALGQFAQRGFDGTSVQRVAGAAGISKQLLLYHFRNKDALKLAVVTEIMERWQRMLPQLMASASNHENALETLLQETVDEIASSPHTSQFILRELMTPGSEVSELLSHAFEPVFANHGEGTARTSFEVLALSLLTVSATYPTREGIRTRHLEEVQRLLLQTMASREIGVTTAGLACKPHSPGR